MFSSEETIDKAYVFEQKESKEKHSDHVYHYIWNKNSPYQRRWIPLRTMLSFDNELQKLRDVRKIPKDSDKNPYKKLKDMPILVNQGSKETVVGNPWSYETFQ